MLRAPCAPVIWPNVPVPMFPLLTIVRTAARLSLAGAVLVWNPLRVAGQQVTAAITGRVTDPSGASVPK